MLPAMRTATVLDGSATYHDRLLEMEASATEARRASGPVRLASNENPFGMSPKAKDAIMQGWFEHSHYGLQSEGVLKQVFAKHAGVDPSNILITQGSSETLAVAALAFGLHGGEVVTAWPTFEGLPRYATSIGATVHKVPLTPTLGHDFAAMDARIERPVGPAIGIETHRGAAERGAEHRVPVVQKQRTLCRHQVRAVQAGQPLLRLEHERRQPQRGEVRRRRHRAADRIEYLAFTQQGQRQVREWGEIPARPDRPDFGDRRHQPAVEPGAERLDHHRPHARGPTRQGGRQKQHHRADHVTRERRAKSGGMAAHQIALQRRCHFRRKTIHVDISTMRRASSAKASSTRSASPSLSLGTTSPNGINKLGQDCGAYGTTSVLCRAVSG
jgi:hypothetical protein